MKSCRFVKMVKLLFCHLNLFEKAIKHFRELKNT
nr:MAG TPA: hypothetical protein [Caudoviricetes sp.]